VPARRPPAALAAFAPAALAMVATPLARRGGRARARLANVVVAGLAATSAASAVGRWGRARTVVAVATIAGGALGVERVGTATGWPFGRYSYQDNLRPSVAGVPVAVPLAWFGMALPAREVATALARTPVGRVVGGAAALTAWDLFLDPQMTAEGYWAWAGAGRYRGIPAGNYAGWFATALAIMAALERLLPPAEPVPALVGVYAWVAAMSTLGFAVFFRDPLVTAIGGAAMVPPAWAAARRVWAGAR
jgi:uncharacterized membrane protein